MTHKNSYKFSIIMLSVILVATLAVAVFADPQNISTPDEPASSILEDKKPIIYLYPTEEMDVKVELGFPENITCSYPSYKNGWTVSANPNGRRKISDSWIK